MKIVLYGPESTGKTSLCKALANHFDVPWVPEYMREFAQRKFDQKGEVIAQEEMLLIAAGQIALENQRAEGAATLLICDTNLLELLVYARYYYPEHCFPALENAFLKHRYAHYFLTYIDTPWVADDLRDRPNDREKMFRIFEEELRHRDLPYTILKGSFSQRLQTAVERIETMYKTRT